MRHWVPSAIVKHVWGYVCCCASGMEDVSVMVSAPLKLSDTHNRKHKATPLDESVHFSMRYWVPSAIVKHAWGYV